MGIRKHAAREGTGYRFKTAKTTRINGNLSAIAAQNAKRVPCEICNLGILPGAMTAHVETVHGED